MQTEKELVKLLTEASNAYYLSEKPIISDAEFDRLRKELQKINPNSSFLKTIGTPVQNSPLTKSKHFLPMGSLDNIFSIEDFNKWIKNTKTNNPQIVAEWKLDGLSIELVYKQGKFIQAITRGDGIEGEDVTHTISQAKGLVKTLKTKADVSIRVEAVLPISTWKKFHSDTANPRNAAAGIVRRKVAENADNLKVIAFDAASHNDSSLWDYEKDKMDWLEDEGFEALAYFGIFNLKEIPQVLEKMEVQRKNLDILTDGVVFKINDLSIQEQLGEHDGRPKWAKAYKFAAAGEHTVVEDVIWQVGSSGNITPVAMVSPVIVGGVTISRVTLHNMDEVERLDVYIGDTVEVVRAGEVIPKIVRVVKPGKNHIPVECKSCPSCNAKTIRVGPILKCSNSNCEGSYVRKLNNYISKRNIMFFGKESVDKLLEAGFLENISDIYTLTLEQMVDAGLGKIMSEKILGEIEKSKKCTIFNLIGSLSIDALGRSEAENIYNLGYKTIKDFLDLTVEKLVGNKGYGEVKAGRIIAGIQKNKDLILAISKHMMLESVVEKPVSKGEKTMFNICLTGAMSRPRKEIEAEIMAKGHTISDSVSKNTTHLCQSDPSSESSKSKKAVKLGIPIISEEELYEMI